MRPDPSNSGVRLLATIMMVTLFAVATCCASPHPLPAFPAEASPQPRASVSFSPGDILEVKFFNVPELNESQPVRPDGKISLQLVGDVDALGKTPEELRQELLGLYTPHLKDPQITVIVRSLQGRRVYVGGEVNLPGALPMPGRLTALEAIMEAGGFNTRTAQIKNVVLIRTKNGQRYGASLDFSKVLNGESDRDFDLEPLDIVFVPRTLIVRVDQWIEQHINGLVPALGIEYSQPAGRGTLIIDTTRNRNVR